MRGKTILVALGAAAAVGCGPSEQQPMHLQFSNQGELCLYPVGETNGVPNLADSTPRTYAAGDVVNVAVQFATCLSSSCSIDRMASCTVGGTGATLQVTSSGSYSNIGSGACTADCGFLIARCQTPTLAAGTVTFQH